MIKTKNGEVKVKGRKADLMSDLACIVHSLIHKAGIEKDQIDFAVELGSTPDDKIADFAMDKIQPILDDLILTLKSEMGNNDKEEGDEYDTLFN